MNKSPAGHSRKQTVHRFLYVLFAALIFLLSSCASAGQKTVMQVGGNKIPYDEYRYFYINHRKTHENGGETGYSDTLKEEVEASLRLKYAKINIAKEHKLTLDDSDMTAVANMKDYFIESYGDIESFRNALTEEALTESLFDDLLEFQALDEKLYEFIIDEYSGLVVSDDKTVEAYINNHFIHATHILIQNESGDDITANLKLAAKLRDRALSGEDFDSLIEQYNEDPGMENDSAGYYFTNGQMIAEFENAARVLDIGEISEVVLSENGYHVIKRLAMDPDYIDEHFEALREAYKARMYAIITEEKAAGLEVEYTDGYSEPDDAVLVSNTVY